MFCGKDFAHCFLAKNLVCKRNYVSQSVFNTFETMKLFFENISENHKVSMDFPLESTLEQALDVFENLPQMDGSTFGLLLEDGTLVQFQKYNRFFWLVEIPDFVQHGTFQALCNVHQCVRLLTEMFNGADPKEVFEFRFQSH